MPSPPYKHLKQRKSRRVLRLLADIRAEAMRSGLSLQGFADELSVVAGEKVSKSAAHRFLSWDRPATGIRGEIALAMLEWLELSRTKKIQRLTR